MHQIGFLQQKVFKKRYNRLKIYRKYEPWQIQRQPFLEQARRSSRPRSRPRPPGSR